MIPVKQTRFRLEHGRGNCMAAALASLLELSLDDVPKFETMGDEWRDVFLNWLKSIGKEFTGWMAKDEEGVPMGYCIGVGPSPRGDFRHAVVLLDGELAFDPHPDDTGLLKLESYWVIEDRKAK